jgi:hypothetical protein
MRFARGDVRDHILSPKIDHGASHGATERDSGREIQKSTFARFLVLSDFRLLQQYRVRNGLAEEAGSLPFLGRVEV